MNEGERLKLVRREQEHYNEIYCKFHKLYHPDPDTDFGTKKMRDRLISFLLKFISDSLKILDIGCGQGFLTEPLAKLGFDIVGLDISGKMCLEAKKRAERKGLKVNYVVANALELPFKKDVFDVAVCYETLQHIPTPEVMIKEGARVAKAVVVETRNAHFLLGKRNASKGDVINRRFREEELMAIANSVGLDCEVDFQSFKHPFLNLLPKLMRKRITYGIWVIGRKEISC